ncbi:MAG: MBL fold metallo-hydrolase, partial [Lysobacterales bacterium]
MLNTPSWNGNCAESQQTRCPCPARPSWLRLSDRPKASEAECRNAGSNTGAAGWRTSSRLPRTPMRPLRCSRPSERRLSASRLGPSGCAKTPMAQYAGGAAARRDLLRFPATGATAASPISAPMRGAPERGALARGAQREKPMEPNLPEVTVTALPAFSDNYIWLIATGAAECAVVDPGDAEPVRRALRRDGLELAYILLTHHHADHIGGAAALSADTGAQVFGPRDARIPGQSRSFGEGERVDLPRLGLAFEVLEVPGHTSSH